jgi:hypothetical protein
VLSHMLPQVFDYTVAPFHQQLTGRPPSPRIHLIFDAIGTPDIFFYSEPYLAPSGLYILTGFEMSGFGDALQYMWNILKMARPVWLGGTNRQFKYVTSKLILTMRLTSTFSPGLCSRNLLEI